jgi:Fe-S cluster assembly protein SufD
VVLSGFTSESAAELGGPSWLRSERGAAVERFLAASLPTDALEEWRYSRIDALDLDRYQPVLYAPAAAADPIPDLTILVEALGAEATLVETHDGHLARVQAGRRGVTVEQLSAPDAPAVDIGGVAGEPDALALLNRAFAPDPVRIRVSRGAEATPIVMVHRSDTDGAAVFPRVLVEVDSEADASVIELVAGSAPALVVPVTELDVAAGARLGYLQVQLLGSAAWQIGLQASRVARDASLVSAAVALGGYYARLRTDSTLSGPGADGRLLAVYFGADHQMHDFRTVQHHQAPKTRSDLLYKGAVANSARSVYSGLIRVEKGAAGTNAMQTNRNLVLHQGAHADSVPNLEIEDNDVRCSHASAVGPIADDERFYLGSRGVPPDVADRLIALGFLDEVLGQLPVPALADSLRLMLAAKLDAADAQEAVSHPRHGVGPTGEDE